MSTYPLHGKVKALAFDVFGTVVDWRGSIIRELTAFGTAHGIDADWTRFADGWRAGYRPAMQRVRTGALPWLKIDALHRLILDDCWSSTAMVLPKTTSTSEPRLAPNGTVARRRAGAHPAEGPIPHHHVVERQFFASHQYGEACRIALGLHRLGRAFPALQARPGNLSRHGGTAGRCRRRADAGGVPSGRSARCAGRGLPDRLRGRLLERAGHPPARVEDGEFDVIAGDFVELAERMGA
jgi:2-haloacid dehalogenase